MPFSLLTRLTAATLALTCSGCAALIFRPAAELRIAVLTDAAVHASDVTVSVQALPSGVPRSLQGTMGSFPLSGTDDYRVTATVPGAPAKTAEVRYNPQRTDAYVLPDLIIGSLAVLTGLGVGAAADFATRDPAGQGKAVGALTGIGLWALMFGIDSLTAPPAGHRPHTLQLDLRTPTGRSSDGTRP